MTVIDELIKICKSDKGNLLKCFGAYKIIKKLGHGQQSVVLNIKNKIGKNFALKCFRPTDDQTNVDDFIREVETLVLLNHKNIVKIYTGGSATWNSKKGWAVTEGFPPKESPIKIEKDQVFFYIMDFIDGFDLAYIFPEIAGDNAKALEEANKRSISDRRKLFEKLIRQVSDGMTYYHLKDITHKDIKPANIRYNKCDNTFIIVDFGFARHNQSPQDGASITRTEYLDPDSISEQRYDKNDMGQFCRMLNKILPAFKDQYLDKRYEGVNAAIEKGFGSLEKRYHDMAEFKKSVESYFLDNTQFQLKIDEFLSPSGFGRFNTKIRIPVSGSILASREVLAVIDTPEFQRLRGVRQLGPTIFVFPGANHTRFEHSLGSYWLTLRYIEKLVSTYEFRNTLVDPLEDSIKLVVLASLLHDIGHYPYSHWVEEIDTFPGGVKLPSHTARARSIITSEDGELRSIIEKIWHVDPDAVADIIDNTSEKETINSFLNSIIDVDKMDYLLRDCIHCGVTYGQGIDFERLLDALYVNQQTEKLCLTEKGLPVLLSILSARNNMYHSVYWHKTVRACEAMFKRFFFEFVSKNNDTAINKIISLSDDNFITFLYNWSEKNGLDRIQQLIKPFALKGRTFIYKPAYIHYLHRYNESNGAIKNYLDKFFNYDYQSTIEESSRLCNALRGKLSCEIDEYDILIEKTPIKPGGERDDLEDFIFYNTRKKAPGNIPSEIKNLNEYLKRNPQVYIFCNPKIYSELSRIFADSKTLRDIVKKL